jgi:hypothetical protein
VQLLARQFALIARGCTASPVSSITERKGITLKTMSLHDVYVFVSCFLLYLQYTGFWVSGSLLHQLIEEKVTVLSVFVDVTPNVKLFFKKVANWIRRELQQETVLVKINNSAFLV